MANNSVDITSTYAGEAAQQILTPAILAADSLANGYVTVAQNVKKSLKIQRLSGTDIQPYSCEPWTNTDDALTLDEVVLTPTKLMFPIELCKSDYVDTWMAMNTGQGFANQQVPAQFVSDLQEYAAARNAEAIEKNLWQGNYNPATGAAAGASVTNFDGILHIAITDGSGSLGYDGDTTGAFTADATATGILTHLDNLVGNAPDAIQGQRPQKSL